MIHLLTNVLVVHKVKYYKVRIKIAKTWLRVINLF